MKRKSESKPTPSKSSKKRKSHHKHDEKKKKKKKMPLYAKFERNEFMMSVKTTATLSTVRNVAAQTIRSLGYVETSLDAKMLKLRKAKLDPLSYASATSPLGAFTPPPPTASIERFSYVDLPLTLTVEDAFLPHETVLVEKISTSSPLTNSVSKTKKRKRLEENIDLAVSLTKPKNTDVTADDAVPKSTDDITTNAVPEKSKTSSTKFTPTPRLLQLREQYKKIFNKNVARKYNRNETWIQEKISNPPQKKKAHQPIQIITKSNEQEDTRPMIKALKDLEQCSRQELYEIIAKYTDNTTVESLKALRLGSAIVLYKARVALNYCLPEDQRDVRFLSVGDLKKMYKKLTGLTLRRKKKSKMVSMVFEALDPTSDVRKNTEKKSNTTKKSKSDVNIVEKEASICSSSDSKEDKKSKSDKTIVEKKASSSSSSDSEEEKKTKSDKIVVEKEASNSSSSSDNEKKNITEKSKKNDDSDSDSESSESDDDSEDEIGDLLNLCGPRTKPPAFYIVPEEDKSPKKANGYKKGKNGKKKRNGFITFDRFSKKKKKRNGATKK